MGAGENYRRSLDVLEGEHELKEEVEIFIHRKMKSLRLDRL